jgi:predicted RNA binding protein YcfA (HicA-like mRNA interferase family)
MAKIEKLIAGIRNNPKAVRFDDLATVMTHFGWDLKTAKGGSHCKFKKAGQPTIIGVIPHGGKKHAHEDLVKDCLAALDGE